jgi:two-component system, NtrC family, response regulator AtoC
MDHGYRQLVVLDHDFCAGSHSIKERSKIICRFNFGDVYDRKEVIANLIHKLSKRAHRPLLKVNCAALPAELLESELFGYERGAFTGAVQSKPGKFELCHKGTILLDEIGELHCSLQAKLLHVLQDGQFSRLGGRSNIVADFRVLAATNVDIQTAVRDGSFREDLYYRLNAFTVQVPPLRERREEIPLFISHFMKKYTQRLECAPMEYSTELIGMCMQYHWPGNLRELENFIKRHLILRDEKLAISELKKAMPSMVLSAHIKQQAATDDLKLPIRGVTTRAELSAIQEVLAATNWNRKLAAKRLNISYKALLYKMKQYGNALYANTETADVSGTGEESKKRATAAG